MPSLEIIRAGLMTSIQDLGRPGLAYYAIPNAGALDPNAAKIALLLLNKPMDHPVIECTSIAPQIRFHDPCRIAVAGADFHWKVNDRKVAPNTVLDIHEGDLLRGGFAKDGFRGYIAIDGDLQLREVYGSYATYVPAKMGGLAGRLLQKGDCLEWKTGGDHAPGRVRIPIHKGPEFHYLTDAAQTGLTSNTYQIGRDTNRMGIRLIGEKLDNCVGPLDHSLPVLPGFIQLPPSGEPIILLRDGQTSGGYPRIAYIPDHYFSTLNQIPLGGELQFEYFGND